MNQPTPLRLCFTALLMLVCSGLLLYFAASEFSYVRHAVDTEAVVLAQERERSGRRSHTRVLYQFRDETTGRNRTEWDYWRIIEPNFIRRDNQTYVGVQYFPGKSGYSRIRSYKGMRYIAGTSILSGICAWSLIQARRNHRRQDMITTDSIASEDNE